MTNSEVVGYPQEHTSSWSLQKITGIFHFSPQHTLGFIACSWEGGCLALFLWTIWHIEKRYVFQACLSQRQERCQEYSNNSLHHHHSCSGTEFGMSLPGKLRESIRAKRSLMNPHTRYTPCPQIRKGSSRGWHLWPHHCLGPALTHSPALTTGALTRAENGASKSSSSASHHQWGAHWSEVATSHHQTEPYYSHFWP